MMTIDELIERLKVLNLPADTKVYIANDRTFTEVDEVLKTRVGTLDNPRTVIAIY